MGVDEHAVQQIPMSVVHDEWRADDDGAMYMCEEERELNTWGGLFCLSFFCGNPFALFAPCIPGMSNRRKVCWSAYACPRACEWRYAFALRVPADDAAGWLSWLGTSRRVQRRVQVEKWPPRLHRHHRHAHQALQERVRAPVRAPRAHRRRVRRPVRGLSVPSAG